ncbi:MAG: hypothetical protein SNJ57_10000 [Cyanobacteriota bacterium]
MPIFYQKTPQDRGYKAACIRELARVTDVAETTIERNWGTNFEKTPEYVRRLLLFADIANRAAVAFPHCREHGGAVWAIARRQVSDPAVQRRQSRSSIRFARREKRAKAEKLLQQRLASCPPPQ